MMLTGSITNLDIMELRGDKSILLNLHDNGSQGCGYGVMIARVLYLTGGVHVLEIPPVVPFSGNDPFLECFPVFHILCLRSQFRCCRSGGDSRG